MLFCFMLILLYVIIKFAEWNRKKKLAEYKRKYKTDTVTYIKYDIPSVKRYRLAMVFSAVFAVLGIAMICSDGSIVSDVDLGLFVILFFVGMYVGMPLFIYFLYHTLSGMAYLKRLEMHGYEMPRDRCIYDNLLERLPKADGLEREESAEQPGQFPYNKTSKILFIVCICVAVFMLGCTAYYIAKWYFMGEDAIALFVLQLIEDVFWLWPIWTFHKEMDIKKYKDDVEIDSSRKNRFDIVNGLALIIILGVIALGIKYTAHSMTAYIYRSMREPDEQVIMHQLENVDDMRKSVLSDRGRIC